MSTSFPDPTPEQAAPSSQAGQVNSVIDEQAIKSWDETKLIEWIQQKLPTLLEESDVKLFVDQRIDGTVFLDGADNQEFFERAKFPFGVSYKLSRLASEIVGQKNSEQAERKYIAKYARENAPDQLKTYIDPAISSYLPFLAPRPHASSRFHFNNEQKFFFYGREKFAEIYREVMAMSLMGKRRLHLHGTIGAGKSHILGALACFLMRQGKRVVYQPDCSALMESPVGDIKIGLIMAFSDDAEILKRVREIGTEAQLENLCCYLSNKDHEIYWLFDQYNALDTEAPGAENEKVAVRRLINSITRLHYAITSASGSSSSGMVDRDRDKSERRVRMYGGLSLEEMDSWWKTNGKSWAKVLSKEDQTALEDFTGRVPFLLHLVSELPVKNQDTDLAMTQIRRCLLDSEDIGSWHRRIMKFIHGQMDKLRKSQNLEMYTNAISACLSGGEVLSDAEPLMDWRFYYVDPETKTGNVAAGIIREWTTKFLRARGASNFLTVSWYSSLKKAAMNPSVLGYYIEQMGISHLSEHGNKALGFAHPPKSIIFNGNIPRLTNQVGSYLYIPSKFNFSDVDCILWRVGNPSKARNKNNGEQGEAMNKAVLTGVQFTIAKDHTNGAVSFFKRAVEWTQGMSCNIEWEFSWIVEERGQEMKDEYIEEAWRGDSLVCPKYRLRRLTVAEISPDMGKSLQSVRVPRAPNANLETTGDSTKRQNAKGDGQGESQGEKESKSKSKRKKPRRRY